VRVVPNPEEMLDAVSASMAARTGRTLDEWVALVQGSSGVDPLDQNAVRRWLKDVHGVPQNSQSPVIIGSVHATRDNTPQKRARIR
jgi:hypothetical protein